MGLAQTGLLCWVGVGRGQGWWGRAGEGLGWAGKSPGEESTSVELRCESVQGGGHRTGCSQCSQVSQGRKQGTKGAKERGPICAMFPGQPGEAALGKQYQVIPTHRPCPCLAVHPNTEEGLLPHGHLCPPPGLSDTQLHRQYSQKGNQFPTDTYHTQVP